MEVLKPPLPIYSQYSPKIPLFAHKFFVRALNKKNPYKLCVSSSKFHSSRSLYLPFSRTRNSQISAHFGQFTSRRRNSLRKKLVSDPKVRENLIALNPDSDFQHSNNSFDASDSFFEDSNYNSVKESGFDDGAGAGIVEESKLKSKSKQLGESALLNDLENWVAQYKKDVEFWGIGSGSIFTVFQDNDGKTKQVTINEGEILRRSQAEGEFEDLKELNPKISYAKSLAREMERGENVIPRNSSVAKFVVLGGESSFAKAVRWLTVQPELGTKISRVGSAVLCGFVIIWAVKKLFNFGNNEVKYTAVEKEMMRRKIKARKEKVELDKGSVEVVQELQEPPVDFTVRPKLDEQELMTSIKKAKVWNGKLALQDSSSSQSTKSMDLDIKIQEIREMARHAREIEGREHSLVENDGEENQDVDKLLSHELLSDEKEEVERHKEKGANFLNLSVVDSEQTRGIDGTTVRARLDEMKSDDTGFPSKEASSTSRVEVSYDRKNTAQDSSEGTSHSTDMREFIHSSDGPANESCTMKGSSIRMKPRIIRSVKEAKEFLSKQRDQKEPNQENPTVLTSSDDAGLGVDTQQSLDMTETVFEPNNKELGSLKRLDIKDTVFGSSEGLDKKESEFETAILGRRSDSAPATTGYEDSPLKDKESVSTRNDGSKDSVEEYGAGDLEKHQTSTIHEDNSNGAQMEPFVKMDNWMEKNFHEVEPLVKKIGVGFRDNFTVAREKVSQQLNINADMTQLGPNKDDSELEWMEDDSLREIVFQVRENELAGRDPFYSMDAEDKVSFFKGLEKKIEKENEKLSNLHEYLHSNIENLDYGADGISLYDPPEKIIPRWKGPPLEKNPEFLDEYLEQRKALFAGNTGVSHPVEKEEENFIQKSTESPTDEDVATCSAPYDSKKKFHGEPKNSKTIIEGSDGSVRSGKKLGKEYWQHTKKWSEGFLESYNAEIDPETKSTMKDIGKDLDRWITEKEIEEAADLMNKIPEKNKKFMEKKLNKLKREMELFGPQAVVSKYREYAEEKEEDYLWWLDLPAVLCIELYTIDNGEQRIGLYSLEMAPDLELEPKPYHVIAFENSGDCKNLCYIIQAHMDMLGNGHAFVVPRPSKDAFREAKANGFGVTVIRKGELELNVDQTLEEVEEQITEIGSKIYHDMITQERSVDISSLMKGVFGFRSRPSKRKKSKRMLKKPRKK